MTPLKKTLSLLAAVLSLAGCATMKEVMPNSNATSVPLAAATNSLPAAQGSVKTSIDSNSNTAVSVDVKHLAPPAKVADGATTYVVWAQPRGADAPQNLGALKVDKNLTGTLYTVLPFDEFKVFITAEPTPGVTAPSGDELLAANVLSVNP